MQTLNRPIHRTTVKKAVPRSHGVTQPDITLSSRPETAPVFLEDVTPKSNPWLSIRIREALYGFIILVLLVTLAAFLDGSSQLQRAVVESNASAMKRVPSVFATVRDQHGRIQATLSDGR